MLTTDLSHNFKKLYHKDATIYAAPGRINVIGEHTDYNNGWVLPASIDKYIYLAIAKNNTQSVNIYTDSLNEKISFSLTDNEIPQPRWSKYFYGVIMELKELKKTIEGVDLFVTSTLPLGSGISSSAALTSGFTFALNDLFNLEVSPLEMAKIGQKCEHHFLGIKCGLMDQFASLFGKDHSLILLDCNSMNYEYISFLFPDVKMVLFDSQVKHQLADTEYNARRRDCELGLEKLKAVHPDITMLRDFDLQILSESRVGLSFVEKQRLTFVLQENERVKNVAKCLKNNDIHGFGKNIFDSHEGLKNLYEVSCPELDFLVENAKNCPGIVGARMMGGGFGGCTINFVHACNYDSFITEMSEKFRIEYGKSAYYIEFNIGNGVHKI